MKTRIYSAPEVKGLKVYRAWLTADYHVVIPLTVVIHSVEGLLTDTVEIHVGPVVQHLSRNVPAVDHGAGGLAQVVQGRLALQRLRKSPRHWEEKTELVSHG